jgi:hypothetical protein
VIYDTALRGVHHQKLLRELGLLPLNRVTAAEKGAKDPRRAKGRRVEKSVHVEDKDILVDGVETRISLYTRGGAVGLAEPDETGDLVFSALRRTRTRRTQDRNRLFRWYNDYELPNSLGGGEITVRLHANEHDKARGLNRTENVRPIPQSDPEFARLYARRNDAESINRALNDTLYLGRAHSVGRRRQLVEVLGYALTVNLWRFIATAGSDHKKRPEAAPRLATRSIPGQGRLRRRGGASRRIRPLGRTAGCA